MAQRIARALLALLCAVAVIYGTAMFPAAFDVELRSEQPGGPSGPSTPAESTGNGPDSTGTATPNASDSGTSSGSPDTESPTPSPSPTETATPVPAASGSAGGDGGGGDSNLGGLLAVILVGGAGVLAALSLGFIANAGRKSWSWPSALTVPILGTRISVPSFSLRRIPQLTTLLIISAGSGLARLVDDVATVVGAVAVAFSAGVGPLAGILARSLTAFPRVLGTLLTAPLHALGAAATLFGGLGFLRGGLSRPSFDSSDAPTADARSENPASPARSDDEESEPIASVVEAWVAMTDLVTVRNPESKTAAEYARAAVAAGLPSAPVERLTALFREVRYGGRADSGDRVSAARRALDAITGGSDR